MAGVYIHIPYCRQACHYCDFHFSTNLQDQELMIKCLSQEISIRKDFLKEPVETIYFGGGTPSLLSVKSLDLLIKTLRTSFIVTNDAEITLEANPDDLSKSKLEQLIMAGINRLSIGIQSFDNTILSYLNRSHDAESALVALTDARQVGFSNISLDLIYAIPDLSMDMWRRTINTALEFKPEHISTYGLTIEDKTPFGTWLKKGQLKLMDEESAARQFETLGEMMLAAGYDQYEISNFSLPGMHSRHNSSYWTQTPYLGVGPGAHSYDGASRFSNVRSNPRYTQSIMDGKPDMEAELLHSKEKINEFILTTLRTKWGCNLEVLKTQLGDDLMARRQAYITQQQLAGLILVEHNVIRLTSRGKLLADKITEDLMVDDSD